MVKVAVGVLLRVKVDVTVDDRVGVGLTEFVCVEVTVEL